MLDWLLRHLLRKYFPIKKLNSSLSTKTTICIVMQHLRLQLHLGVRNSELQWIAMKMMHQAKLVTIQNCCCRFLIYFILTVDSLINFETVKVKKNISFSISPSFSVIVFPQYFTNEHHEGARHEKVYTIKNLKKKIFHTKKMLFSYCKSTMKPHWLRKVHYRFWISVKLSFLFLILIIFLILRYN